MKFILVVATLVMSVSAFAQKHMVNFDASEISGVLSWTTGSNTSEQRDREITLNYAYTLLPKLQLGTKVTYQNDAGSEGYGLQVGGIYNLNENIRSSFYGSLFVGMLWNSTADYETQLATVAVGKRIPLSFINNENFVYSPEVAWTSGNFSDDLGYAQELAVKFLNFSLFF